MCFIKWCAQLAGNGQRLAVIISSLAGVCGPGRELAEAVQIIRLDQLASRPGHQLTYSIGWELGARERRDHLANLSEQRGNA